MDQALGRRHGPAAAGYRHSTPVSAAGPSDRASVSAVRVVSAAQAPRPSALHSYTLSLREQLRGTNVAVVEIVPPLVNTAMGGVQISGGVDVDVFADAVFERMEQGEPEIGYGAAETRRLASRQELDAYTAQLNAPAAT